MPGEPDNVRNLVAFVADDVRLELPWNCAIDIWREPDIGISKQSSASGWLRHVEDIYRNKSIAFDLLSIDVFYTEDFSDPVFHLLPDNGEPPPSKNISSGLVHGLAAMARRRHSIDGNVMPLAFEVRTVSPSKEGLGIDQWCEITRMYGILLALMTPYTPDRGFMGLDMHVSPALAVRNAFMNQPISEGAALGLAGLLKDWRKRFLDNLKAGDLSVDVTELKKIEHLQPQAMLAAPNGYVALIGRNGQICDRIALRSIFTDLALVDEPDYVNVGNWISEIISVVDDLIGKAESTAKWVENLFAHRVPRSPRLSPPEDIANYWETIGDLGQTLALVAAHVAPVIAPLDYPKFNGQTDFANAVGAEHFGENKIKRMFEASNHIRVKTMRELKKCFLEDLSDSDLIAPMSPLFIRSLAHSMAMLGLTEKMETRAPILFKALHETP